MRRSLRLQWAMAFNVRARRAQSRVFAHAYVARRSLTSSAARRTAVVEDEVKVLIEPAFVKVLCPQRAMRGGTMACENGACATLTRSARGSWRRRTSSQIWRSEGTGTPRRTLRFRRCCCASP